MFQPCLSYPGAGRLSHALSFIRYSFTARVPLQEAFPFPALSLIFLSASVSSALPTTFSFARPTNLSSQSACVLLLLCKVQILSYLEFTKGANSFDNGLRDENAHCATVPCDSGGSSFPCRLKLSLCQLICPPSASLCFCALRFAAEILVRA